MMAPGDTILTPPMVKPKSNKLMPNTQLFKRTFLQIKTVFGRQGEAKKNPDIIPRSSGINIDLTKETLTTVNKKSPISTKYSHK